MANTLTLGNGAKIVYENIDSVRSVTAGIWITSGSRHEPAGKSGISHFIEHMLFKGTEKHSCAEMAELFDSVGGHANAYTTKDITAYYVKALDVKLRFAGGLLSDMLFCPKLAPKDLETERSVIFEEMGMYEDDPEDLAIEKLSDKVFRTSSLGRQILGNKAALRKITSADLKKYMNEKYSGENIVVAISGKINEDDIKYLADKISALPAGKRNINKPAEYIPSVYMKKKNYEQNHFSMLFPSVSCTDEKRHAATLLSGILGGGMSSRLFRKIREEQGLCYSVFSFENNGPEEGLFGIYTATGKETQDKALSLIREELERIREDGVSGAELDLVREKTKANILLGLESTSARASYLARSQIYFGNILDYDSIIEQYDAVTRDDIAGMAQKIINFNSMSFSAVGKINDTEHYSALLGIKER